MFFRINLIYAAKTTGMGKLISELTGLVCLSDFNLYMLDEDILV